MPFAGIPATIDNDISGTDYCLGVDTALNMIRSSVDSIRDTASSFSRAFVIETMGRDCGYLAMVVRLQTAQKFVSFQRSSMTSIRLANDYGNNARPGNARF